MIDVYPDTGSSGGASGEVRPIWLKLIVTLVLFADTDTPMLVPAPVMMLWSTVTSAPQTQHGRCHCLPPRPGP